MNDQLSFTAAATFSSDAPSARERALAGVVAGFVYPGRGSFDALRKVEQAACLSAARLALEEARIGMASS